MNPKKNSTAARNTEIVKLHSEGWSCAEIAFKFGISRSRAGQIIQQVKHRDLFKERGKEFRRTIREAHDLTLRIPLDDLCCAFSLSPKLEQRIYRHYTGRGIRELSLTDFMDFLIPDIVNLRGLNHTIPACRVQHIGSKTYADILKAINLVGDELGEVFKVEWTRRKMMLKECMIANNFSDSFLTNVENPPL